MTKEIQLTQGKVALVDDEDYEWLSQWKWYYHHEGYAIRHMRIHGKQIIFHMHRVIMNTPNGMQTDHINRDGLDNRRCNLRICTIQQNSANSSMRSNNTSGAKGITLHKKTGKWQAQIGCADKTFYLGLFTDINEARIAYIQKAKEIFGEFANGG